MSGSDKQTTELPETETSYFWTICKYTATGMAGAAVAAAGAAHGAYNIGKQLYSFAAIRDKEIEEKKARLRAQGIEYQQLLDEAKNDGELELLSIGTVNVAALLRGGSVELPADIQVAYEAAYPNMAAEISLTDWAAGKSQDEVSGVVNGIKGKLFEMRYVDALNNSLLPDGYTAELALSATQPGWDIAISGPYGDVVKVLQAKATDSAGYVKSALERYPDIDVVTTDEVFDKIVMHGAAEQSGDVMNSGISDAALEASVADAVQGGDMAPSADIIDMPLPLLSLAIIAFTEYQKPDKSAIRKWFSFGSRSMKTWSSLLVGSTAVALLGGGLPVAIIASLGTNYFLSKGEQKRLVIERLDGSMRRNEQRLNQLRDDIARARRKPPLTRAFRWLKTLWGGITGASTDKQSN